MKGKQFTAAVYQLYVKDEAGRDMLYYVQVDPIGVSCWIGSSPGGRLTPPELFAACVMAKGRK